MTNVELADEQLAQFNEALKLKPYYQLVAMREEWTGTGELLKATYSKQNHFWADLIEHADCVHVMRYFFIGTECHVSCDLETRDINEAWEFLLDMHVN